MRGETVYERTKRTGYMMGPDHPLAKTKDSPAEESVEEKKPPNLRNAVSEAQICGTCDHFSGMACGKFANYPVKFHEGCDAHSAYSEEEGEESEMAEAGEPAPEDEEA